MKYVIESAFENMSIQKIMQLGLDANGRITNWTDAIEDVEELNSDYINEHYGELQDEAYQQGLNDAWEAARKIVTWPDRSLVNSDTFDLDHGESIFTKYSASEAIAKLKAYEDKRSDRIEVGDEVEWDDDFTGDRFIVTRIYQPYGKKEQCDGIDDDGDVYRAVLIESLVKTGKHYDIQSILEAMQK